MNPDRIDPSAPPSAGRITLIGALCMAAAMGIGRFAFPPLLPLMQQAQGLALRDGTWLAMINYLGYLVGAIAGYVWPLKPGFAARLGVGLVAVSTLAMAGIDGMIPWLALRFVSGIASAFVMVGVAGWALAQLATLKRGALGGIVFGTVGISIALAGGVVFIVGTTVGDPHVAWGALGVISAVIAVITWRPLSHDPATQVPASTPSTTTGGLGREVWLLIVCYGVAGFGYIVPATFLPAAARVLVNDPRVFGWIWPVFGVAAAIGTIGVSTLLPNASPRRICAIGMLVMAVGTGLPVLPVLHLNITTLILSAICVGGTFIVVTLAGIQETRRLAQPAPARAVAALTASFALGQLMGPVLAHAGESAATALRLPSIVATIGLVISALILLVRRR